MPHQNPTSYRSDLSLQPTLVICLGKYGRDVGLQLAARLRLTETWQHRVGDTRPLIARANSPGQVRIMKVDWRAWDNGFYHPQARRPFLEDLEQVQDPAVAERPTEPSRVTSDWPIWETNEMRIRLKNVRAQLLEAALPLRQYVGQSRANRSKDFSLRVLVVGAARETPNSELIADLVGMLGEIYVTRHRLASGIQVLCYVGGTSLQEHVAAGGTEDTYMKNNYIGLKREWRRIIGDASKSNVWIDGMITRLSRLWPSPLEMCYLLDAQLANLLVPARGRTDEPDEVVVAAALGLDMIITTGADQCIRQITPSPAIQTVHKRVAGPFASLGVASYSADHPRLHRLIHSWLLGDFLIQALPQTRGEVHWSGPAQQLLETGLEEQVQRQVDEAVKQFEENLSFSHLQQKSALPHQPIPPVEDVLTRLSHCDPRQWNAIKKELSSLAPDVNSTSLLTLFHDTQKIYMDALHGETENARQVLYAQKQAPLTQVYRLLQQSKDSLRQMVDTINPPLNVQDMAREQQDLVDRLVSSYQQEESAKALNIQRMLQHRPGWINALWPTALVWLVPFALLGLIVPFSLPILLSSLLILPSSLFIHTLRHRTYRSKLKRELMVLASAQEVVHEDLQKDAWHWALVMFTSELNDLSDLVAGNCRPGGLLAQLRDDLRGDDVVVKAHMLEQLFLDDQLKQQLRNFAYHCRERSTLWQQRAQILPLVAEMAATSSQPLEDLLRKHVEKLSQDLQWRIADIVGSYFAQIGNRHLEEIYRALSNAAVLFLRYEHTVQEDSATQVVFLSMYPQDENEMREIITHYPQIHAIESVDRLRWTFMRVYTGLHFDSIKFSVASLIPP